MTTSQVKSGLDALSNLIQSHQDAKESLKTALTSLESQLNAIPTDSGPLITEIGTFTPTGEFEGVAKDELAKLTTEFIALKASVTAAIAAL